MNNSITNQFYLLLIFMATGIFIGILFDIFRILRKSFKTPDTITYIEDILFWIITGIILLFVIFRFNNGEIRAYLFCGMAIGTLFYLFTISKYFIKVSVIVIRFLQKIIGKIIHIIFIPLSWIKHLFFKPISFCIINMKKTTSNFIRKIRSMIKLPKLLQKKQKNVAQEKDIGI